MIWIAVLAWLVFLLLFFLERRQVLIGFSFLMVSGLTMLALGANLLNQEGPINPLVSLVIGVLGFIFLVALVFGPFLLVTTLFYNSWQLLRREGTRWYNFLSLGLALGLSVYLYLFPRLGNQLQSPTIWYYLYVLIGLWMIYAAALSISYTVASFLNLINLVTKPLNYVVVLGAGLNGEEVTPLLASRINKGIAIYRKNKGSKLIMSGGQGADEVISEAQAMTNYAVKQGVPVEDILLENQSTNTRENIRYSVGLMTGEKRFAIVTNYYHLFRALIFARKEGVKCIGYGAKTKFYFSLNAFIREFVGYLTISWKWHAGLLGLLTLTYLVVVALVLKG